MLGQLSGRQWVVALLGIAYPAFIGVLILGGLWIVQRPERQVQLLALAPYLLGAVATFKVAVAFLAFRAAWKHGLLETSLLLAFLAGWLLFVASAVTLAWMLLPDDGMPVSKGFAIAAFAMFAPLARFALAPLAFEWNRHR
jgi:hypothetical protein